MISIGFIFVSDMLLGILWGKDLRAMLLITQPSEIYFLKSFVKFKQKIYERGFFHFELVN